MPMPTEQDIKALLTQPKIAYQGAIPVTIITGFLGAGKTTLILNLIKDLPKEYRIAWLKNEFGNTEVDSLLGQETHVATTKEMLQGCICHVLVGQLQQALEELLLTNPGRIIIETSGSAAPAPIVWEIRKNKKLYVDGVITVIDAKNFSGYKDKSYTAKLQAKYTDMILINKHEGIPESTLEDTLDDVYELNPDAPKIKTAEGYVSPQVIFGLDSKLFITAESVKEEEKEVEENHQSFEVDLIELEPTRQFRLEAITYSLESFPAKKFYRIKGILNIDGSLFVLNYAYGEFRLFPLKQQNITPRLVFMGEHIGSYQELVREVFGSSRDIIRYTPAHDHQHHH